MDQQAELQGNLYKALFIYFLSFHPTASPIVIIFRKTLKQDNKIHVYHQGEIYGYKLDTEGH